MADQQTPSTAIPIRVALVDTNGAIIGSLPVTIADNGDFALGSVADAQWSGVGNATAISLLKKIASGGGGGSGPVTVIDGGDVAEGATTDAAVITDTTGTVSGKLRGLVKIFADVWDSVNHRLNVALPTATVTTLTPPAAITGFALDATVLAGNVVLEDIDVDVEAVTTAIAVDQPRHLTATVLPTGAATPTDGIVTATVPGAPTQLPTVAAKLVALIASPSNVDDVVVGSSTVRASNTARTGLPLGPGDMVTLPVSNLNVLYVDCRVPGDSVSYAVLA